VVAERQRRRQPGELVQDPRVHPSILACCRVNPAAVATAAWQAG
jgi:hypothetical protein